MKAPSKVFCLAGMHRSGTSLMANWLHDSGLFIGDQLYGVASSNKKGHFEDLEFLELHKSDLDRKKLDVSGLLINNNQLELDEISVNRAYSIIEERNQHLIWGWKEPRTTIYIKFWKKLIPTLKVIAIYREPEYVIDSLYKRLLKNKWYKTRNPLKRFYWYFDIDLRKSKWMRRFLATYNLYNQSIIEFYQLYPKDTIILSLSDVKLKPKEAAYAINNFLSTDIDFIDFQKIYTSKFLTQEKPLNLSADQLKTLEELNKLKFAL